MKKNELVAAGAAISMISGCCLALVAPANAADSTPQMRESRATKGSLRVALQTPKGAEAKVVVKGLSQLPKKQRFKRVLTSSKTLKQLKPGRYRIIAAGTSVIEPKKEIKRVQVRRGQHSKRVIRFQLIDTAAEGNPTRGPKPPVTTPTANPTARPNPPATATPGVPATPTGLQAVPFGQSVVNVSWQATSGATSYTVFRDGTQISNTGATTVTDSGLSAGATYGYSVQANGAVGSSAISASVSATTAGVVPPDDSGTTTKVMCTISSSAMPEISGLIASVRHPGILWANNDSGDSARIYAIDSTTCAIRATVNLAGVSASDFEAISMGRDSTGAPELWVGDVGDNAGARANVKLHRFLEPAVLQNQSVAVKTVTVSWDGGARDCESLVVEPIANGRVFLMSKQHGSGGTYQLQGNFRSTGLATTGSSLGTIKQYATDAAVAPNMSKTIIRFSNSGTLFNGLPGTSPKDVRFPTQAQGEAITFSHDSKYVFIASEGTTELIRIPVSIL